MQKVSVTVPGRVNYLGEHTDYNNGWVLPAPAGKFLKVEIERSEGDEITVYASDYKDSFRFLPGDIPEVNGWKAYPVGYAALLVRKGYSLKGGITIRISSDIPAGAGMSSSAALCCGLGLALKEYFELPVSKEDIALLAQQTEHEFAGVKCGIMDQYAVLFGKEKHLLKLDCRSLEYSYIPFDFPDYCTVLLNSGVHHSLADSEYNTRRKQCEEGMQIIKHSFPQTGSLRDVTMEMLDHCKNRMDPVVYKRCKYVTEENARVEKGCELLNQEDIKSFGRLMNLTHWGLSEQYEVSCPELDFLAKEAQSYPGVIGSRMMGGGFGGCTINIVRKDNRDAFIRHMQEKYGKELPAYQV